MILIPFTTDTFVIETGQPPEIMSHGLGDMASPEAKTFTAAVRFMAGVGYPVATIDTSGFDWQTPLAPEEAAWARGTTLPRG